MNTVMYTDGGARGNPGPAGIGIVIKNDRGETVKEMGIFIGEATNNDAEYQALIKGMEECTGLGVTELTCMLDSQLVVRQLTGEYKVKNPRMKEYWNTAKHLESNFIQVRYVHVQRTENKRADFLVNQVLEAADNAKRKS